MKSLIFFLLSLMFVISTHAGASDFAVGDVVLVRSANVENVTALYHYEKATVTAVNNLGIATDAKSAQGYYLPPWRIKPYHHADSVRVRSVVDKIWRSAGTEFRVNQNVGVGTNISGYGAVAATILDLSANRFVLTTADPERYLDLSAGIVIPVQ